MVGHPTYHVNITMNRRVTPPTKVTTPNWGPPPPCIQALRLISKQRLWVTRKWLIPGKRQTSICNTHQHFPFFISCCSLHLHQLSSFKPVSSITNILDSFSYHNFRYCQLEPHLILNPANDGKGMNSY